MLYLDTALHFAPLLAAQQSDKKFSLENHDFCQEIDGSQALVDGDSIFSGNFNEDTGKLMLDASSTGITLQTSDGSENVTIDFDLSLSLEEDAFMLGLNLGLGVMDNVAGDKFEVQDLVLNATGQAPNPLEITLSARLVDPEEGFVVLSTVEPFIFANDVLQSGTLRVDGAGSTQAVVVVDNNVLQFEADTDGDGERDDLSAVVSCTDAMPLQ